MFRVITGNRADEWMHILNKTMCWDFYHLASYHDISKALGEGEPFLFVLEQDEYVIALPLLIRPIGHLPLVPADTRGLSDATSVYGYAGPVASHSIIPSAALHAFQESLQDNLRKRKVVSLFCRLHPIIDQLHLLSGLGTIVRQGQTVVVQVSVDRQTQFMQYRVNHQRGIARLKSMGANCTVDERLKYIDEFFEIYDETMNRVQADSNYRFPKWYFQRFAELQGAKAVLVFCFMQNAPVAAGLFVKCGEIVEFHLGGTSASMLRFAPMKLVIDEAIEWARANRAKVVHLGGGVGSKEDSLYHFKKGFADSNTPFWTWRWILMRNEYEMLSAVHQDLSVRNQPRFGESGFFPEYRIPLEQRSQ